ncbi:MAG: FAD-dependent oxidoreductase [Candidatus Asgardarchaeia archaeon]
MDSLFDVIVIGGGITGVAIARDASMRGLKVLLIERKDFGSGASGTCMGMMGGPVGIPNDLEFTKMNAHEVYVLKKIAAPFVEPRPFLSLVLSEDDYEAQKKQFDIFWQIIKPYGEAKPTFLNEPRVKEIEPGFSDSVKGAFLISEYELDVFRIIIQNLLSARKYGCVALNYKEVISINIREGGSNSVTTRDTFTGEFREYKGKFIINATGVWAPKIANLAGFNDIRMRPTKGTILIADGHISNIGFQFRGIDGNFKEVTLHRNSTLMGPTYDDYFEDPDDLTVSETEIHLILDSIKDVYPRVAQERILRAMTGLRPLPYFWGVPPAKVPRPITIIDHTQTEENGFITIIGGNFTIHRLMAEKLVDLLMKKLRRNKKCFTDKTPLVKWHTSNLEKYHKKYKIPKAILEPLSKRQPENFEKILGLTKNNPNLKNLICTCESIMQAEIEYVLKNEWIRDVDDLRRRTRIGFGPCQGTFCSHKILFVLKRRLPTNSMVNVDSLINFWERRWRGIHPVIHSAQLSQLDLNLSIFYNYVAPHFAKKLVKEVRGR